MARCKVCDHKKSKAIDADLAAGRISIRRLSADYTLSESSLRRHRANHLPTKLVKSEEARRVAESDDLGEQVRALRTKALDLLQSAEEKGDERTALSAIRETRGLLELMEKVQGRLSDAPNVNVAVSVTDSWPALRVIILKALESHTEAKADVLRALEVEAGR